MLAGGKSTRMQFDKQLLEINGEKMLENLVLRLGKIFEEIIVVANAPVRNTGDKCGYTIIKDEIKGKGPLGGIHAGLRNASASGEYAYFLACDMPRINPAYIDYMKKRIADSGADACVTKAGEWIEPFNAFYSRSIADKIEKYLANNDRSSIYSFIRQLNCIYIGEDKARKFSPDWDMFLNLNTKAELAGYIDSIRDK